MTTRDWRDLDDAALERLLVERWLYRGALVAVMCLSAVVCPYLGVQGLTTFADSLAVAVVVGLGLAAAVVAFAMRWADLRMHRELRRRRHRSGEVSGPPP